MTIINSCFSALDHHHATLHQLRSPSDGVALKAPIVAFGLLQHLPEGALPLTSLLWHGTAEDLEVQMTAYALLYCCYIVLRALRQIGKYMQLQIVLKETSGSAKV